MLTATKKDIQTVNYPSNSFTFKNLEELNRDIPSQTLRLRLKQAMVDGKVEKSDEIIATGKPGRGQYVYYLVN